MNAITPMKPWKTPVLRAFFFILGAIKPLQAGGFIRVSQQELAGGQCLPAAICANLTNFVELRGGDYFFMPSLTALQMMASGTVDPR